VQIRTHDAAPPRGRPRDQEREPGELLCTIRQDGRTGEWSGAEAANVYRFVVPDNEPAGLSMAAQQTVCRFLRTGDCPSSSVSMLSLPSLPENILTGM
jgi:hypothetical protein